jgi:hypothetical protein
MANTVTDYLPDIRTQSYLTTVKGGMAMIHERLREITATLSPNALVRHLGHGPSAKANTKVHGVDSTAAHARNQLAADLHTPQYVHHNGAAVISLLLASPALAAAVFPEDNHHVDGSGWMRGDSWCPYLYPENLTWRRGARESRGILLHLLQ